MKLHLRWQLFLAFIGFSLVFSLLSFQVQTVGLCSTQVPAAGGTFREGIVGAPQYLNPLLADPYPVDRELVSLLFDGLTRYDASGRLAPNLAESWRIGEDGRSVRFVLRDDVTWHDGEPVTVDDVVFTYSLLQDDAFPGAAALKSLWQSVTIHQIDERTVEFVLAEPYSPFLAATTRGLLPAHILEGVTAASLPDHEFNQAPIGTGPWLVEPGQDWQSSRRLRLTPNPAAWRQGTQISALEFRFYPDEASLLAAFNAGEIHAINSVSATLLPQVANVQGVRLFTVAAPQYTQLLFNLTVTGSPALQSAEVRQGLAYALDRDVLIDTALNGQGLPLEGPYLPSSWAHNPAQMTLYPTNPISATTLLTEAGWGLPEGQTIRQRENERLALQLLTLATETHQALAQELQRQWAEVGVDVQIETAASLATLREQLAERTFDVALIDVSPLSDPDLYDFWSQEAIIRGQNYAGWNNRRASEALEGARQLWRVDERRPYYDTFLRLFSNDLPALTLYQHIDTYALSPEVNRAEIGEIDHPRERFETFANWFLLYRDVTVSCPPEDT